MALSKVAQDVLARATTLIGQKSRWIKGHDVVLGADGNINYCALGAIQLASKELVPTSGLDRLQIIDAVVSAVRTSLKNRYGRGSIPAFNDDFCTTHDQVKQIFCDTVKRETTGTDTDD